MSNTNQLLNEFFDKEKEKLGKQNTEAKEEVKPDTTEKPVETTEKPVEQTEKVEDIWSPVVGKHFKNPDEFNSFYETANKWKEENEKLNSILAEVEDPSTYFSSPESFKREQLLMKRNDISLDVADKIVKSDIKTLSPIEKLELEMLLENPDIKGGLEGVKELIRDKYNLIEGEEIPRSVENKILIDSKSAEKKLEQTRLELKDYEKRDYKAQYEAKKQEFITKSKELTEKWTSVYDQKLSQRFKDFSLTDKGEDGKETVSFTYKVEDEYVNNSKEALANAMVSLGVNPDSEEGLTMAEKMYRGEYLSNNWDKILRAYGTYVESRIIEKQSKERAGMDNPDRTKTDGITNTKTDANGFYEYFKDMGVKRK